MSGPTTPDRRKLRPVPCIRCVLPDDVPRTPIVHRWKGLLWREQDAFVRPRCVSCEMRRYYDEPALRKAQPLWSVPPTTMVSLVQQVTTGDVIRLEDSREDDEPRVARFG